MRGATSERTAMRLTAPSRKMRRPSEWPVSLPTRALPHPVVVELRRLNHDVAEIGEAGLAGKGFPDESVLDLATADGRAVLTLDRTDFIRLHRLRGDHAGIIICTFDADFIRLATRIDRTLSMIDRLDRQLIRVTRPGPGSE